MKRVVMTVFKPILLIMVLFVLLSRTFIGGVSFQGGAGLDLQYRVIIERGDELAHIELVVSGVRSGSLSLELRPEAQESESYFSNLSAMSGGRSLRVYNVGQGKWRISSIHDEVVIDYDVAKIVPFAWHHPFASGNEVAVYIDDEVGYIMAPFFFIYPANSSISSIRLRFEVPEDWQVVTPYIDEGDHFIVQQVSRSLLTDFICRQQIYMGRMRFYVEKVVDSCTIKFGVPEGDHGRCTEGFLATREGVEAYVDATAAALRTLAQIFGENPYKTYVMYTNFEKLIEGEWLSYPGTRYFGNGYQYWPEHRWDELVTHMVLSFMDGWSGAPLEAHYFIEKGIGEDYFGHILAWELFRDTSYLAKIYYYYLLYERMLTSNRVGWEEFQGYVKGEFVGWLLDKEIQKVTSGSKKLADAFRYLYSTYKNTGHEVTYLDLELAIESLTGTNFSSIFSRYVYGNEKLPVHQYIKDYKEYFLGYHRVVESDVFGLPFYGHTIPFFILIEMATSLSTHIPAGLYNRKYLDDFARYMLATYEVDEITEKDVEEALTKLTGTDSTGFFGRWQDSYGRLSLEELKAWLKDYQDHGGSSSQQVIANDDRAELMPSEFTEGEATTVTLIVRDERFVVGNRVFFYIHLSSEFEGDPLALVKGLEQPFSAVNPYGILFVAGYIPVTELENHWEGTFSLVPTTAMIKMGILTPDREQEISLPFTVRK